MCINKKVVGGLAIVGLGIWWLAPGAIAAALPLLLIAICPLSMLFMMKAMGGMNGQRQGQSTATTASAEPAVLAGQLTLPVDGDRAAPPVAKVTSDGASEAGGGPAEQVTDAPAGQRLALPVTAESAAETASSN